AAEHAIELGDPARAARCLCGGDLRDGAGSAIGSRSESGDLLDDAGARALLDHCAPLLALAAAAHPFHRRPAAFGADEGGCSGASGSHVTRLGAASDVARRLFTAHGPARSG